MSYPGTFVESFPDKPAVIMAGSGEVLTYAELDERATRLANLLGSLGLAAGDHVAFCIENQIRFLEVAWGCHYAGLYYTAASTRLTPGELSYIIDDCGARVFISSQALGDLAQDTVADTPTVEARLMLDGVVDGFTSYEDALA
ncbi:MAG TPA: AMP-binding protein, partial [Iamia sp.]|nr:AMP-binding protein [Iamia sp.]